jgi:hypothetical protein
MPLGEASLEVEAVQRAALLAHQPPQITSKQRRFVHPEASGRNRALLRLQLQTHHARCCVRRKLAAQRLGFF